MYGAYLAGVPSLYCETTWTRGGEAGEKTPFLRHLYI